MRNYIYFEELQMMKDRFYFFAEEAVMKKPEIAYHELGEGEVFKVKAGPDGAIVLPYANASAHIMIEALRDYEDYDGYDGMEERLFYHYHNAVEVSIVVEGEGYYFVEGTAIKVQKGSIILFNSLVPHAWIASEEHPAIQRTFTFFPTLLFDQEIKQSGNELFKEFWEVHRVSYTQEDAADFFYLWQQIYKEYEEKGEGYQQIIKQLIAIFLLYEVRRHRTCQNAKKKKVVHVEVDHAVRYMRQNFQRNITLEEVAKAIYMHPNYLSSLFKKTYGIPFAEYMNMLKVSMATELMQTTDLDLEEIARQSGFSSVSNFYRVFKKVYNMSPGQYNKQNDDEIF
ncbi:MAG: AraC family transcriptional regulator [Cellulosilyticaceae bacterium]